MRKIEKTGTKSYCTEINKSLNLSLRAEITDFTPLTTVSKESALIHFLVSTFNKMFHCLNSQHLSHLSMHRLVTFSTEVTTDDIHGPFTIALPEQTKYPLHVQNL